MEVADRTIRERAVQALVVFLVLLAFRYYRGAVDWAELFAVVAVFVVVMLAIDLVRQTLVE